MDKDFKDYIDIGPDDILNDLKRQQEAVSPATDELRLKLNEIIAKYRIDASTTLIVLSNLSAGYVHQMQRGQEPSYRDAVEDMFQRGFKTCLAHYDLLDVNDEVEKMKKQELN